MDACGTPIDLSSKFANRISLELIIMLASRRESNMSTRRHVSCNHCCSPVAHLCVYFEIGFITSGYFNRNINISLLVVKRAFYGESDMVASTLSHPNGCFNAWMCGSMVRLGCTENLYRHEFVNMSLESCTERTR